MHICIDMRHLGGHYCPTGSNVQERELRVQATHAGGCALKRYWTKRSPKSLKRMAFVMRVHSSAIKGLESYVLGLTDFSQLDKKLTSYLQVLVQGAACDHDGPHIKKMTNI